MISKSETIQFILIKVIYLLVSVAVLNVVGWFSFLCCWQQPVLLLFETYVSHVAIISVNALLIGVSFIQILIHFKHEQILSYAPYCC